MTPGPRAPATASPGWRTQRLRLDDLDAALAALGSGEVIRQVIIQD
jgi:hypothetical protein